MHAYARAQTRALARACTCTRAHASTVYTLRARTRCATGGCATVRRRTARCDSAPSGREGGCGTASPVRSAQVRSTPAIREYRCVCTPVSSAECPVIAPMSTLRVPISTAVNRSSGQDRIVRPLVLLRSAQSRACLRRHSSARVQCRQRAEGRGARLCSGWRLRVNGFRV
jgi:hypothetical protein